MAERAKGSPLDLHEGTNGCISSQYNSYKRKQYTVQNQPCNIDAKIQTFFKNVICHTSPWVYSIWATGLPEITSSSTSNMLKYNIKWRALLQGTWWCHSEHQGLELMLCCLHSSHPNQSFYIFTGRGGGGTDLKGKHVFQMLLVSEVFPKEHTSLHLLTRVESVCVCVYVGERQRERERERSR